MVLTRSGREVQRRLSSSSASEATKASKKGKASKKSKNVETSPSDVAPSVPVEAAPRSWFMRMLLYPLTPLTVIWTLSGIFMCTTGVVYPDSHPVLGPKGKLFQYVRRAFGILLLIATGVMYGYVQYQKDQHRKLGQRQGGNATQG